MTTQEEKYSKHCLEQYGCVDPKCGNCMWLRSTGKSLRCLPGIWEPRDFESVKCSMYKYNPDGIKTATEDELNEGWKDVRRQAIKEWEEKRDRRKQSKNKSKNN